MNCVLIKKQKEETILKKRTFFITSALVLLAPSVLSFSQQAQAASLVGTTNAITSLVDSTGKTVTNRALGANTAWKLGKIVNIDGNTYYQVATNEYALSTNITVEDNTDTTTDTNTNTDTTNNNVAGKIGTLTYACKVVDANGKETGSVLEQGTTWKLGETKTIDGSDYYQVGTNNYIIADGVKVSEPTTNNNTNTIPTPNNGLIATTNVAARTYNDATNSYDQTLPAGSAWKISKLVVNKYGSYWGKISSNQYVWLGDVTINSGINLKDNSEYIADFATSINK